MGRWGNKGWSAAGGTNWTINFICIVIVHPTRGNIGNSPFVPSFQRLNSEIPGITR